MKSEVQSPCIQVCKLENNMCVGCGRSKRDIKNWLQYSNEKKYQIIKQIKKGKR